MFSVTSLDYGRTIDHPEIWLDTRQMKKSIHSQLRRIMRDLEQISVRLEDAGFVDQSESLDAAADALEDVRDGFASL